MPSFISAVSNACGGRFADKQDRTGYLKQSGALSWNWIEPKNMRPVWRQQTRTHQLVIVITVISGERAEISAAKWRKEEMLIKIRLFTRYQWTQEHWTRDRSTLWNMYLLHKYTNTKIHNYLSSTERELVSVAKQTIEKEQINGNKGSVPGWRLSGLVLVHKNGYKFPTVDLQILHNVKL